RHGHIRVNGRKVDIPSYILKVNDVILLREKSLKSFEPVLIKARKRKLPNWLTADYDGNMYVYARVPSREELDVPVNEQFVIEFYSR
ncbi:MAG: S4 domain-containing protein, partial [Candidatus Margulisiibacteriota bacterium]